MDTTEKRFYEIETKKELTKMYQVIKKELLLYHRKTVHFTKKELLFIFEAMKSGDWQKVYETRLYQKYGGEYCSILQVIWYLFGD